MYWDYLFWGILVGLCITGIVYWWRKSKNPDKEESPAPQCSGDSDGCIIDLIEVISDAVTADIISDTVDAAISSIFDDDD